MKKILLIMVCALMAVSASAQEGNLKFGAKAGVNFSGLWGDGAEGTKGKFGYQAGLLAEYRVSSSFAIAPELMFTSEGSKMGIDNLGRRCNYINYIALPVMFKYYTGDNFSLNFGPQFGYAVYNHLAGEEVNSDAYNKFNCGLAVGASYYINKNLFVDARYTMGLTNIYKSPVKDNKSYNVSLGLGYYF